MRNPMRKPARRAIFAWMARRYEQGLDYLDEDAFRAENPHVKYDDTDWIVTRNSFQYALAEEHERQALAQALPCPFCGSVDLDVTGHWIDGPSCYECTQGPEAVVICTTCGAQGPDVHDAHCYDDPVEEAVRQWNQRKGGAS